MRVEVGDKNDYVEQLVRTNRVEQLVRTTMWNIRAERIGWNDYMEH